jgi:prefoldin subunit 5
MSEEAKEPVEQDYDDTFDTVGKKLDELEKLIVGNTDAVKELTTIIADLAKENAKWYRAGRFNQ